MRLFLVLAIAAAPSWLQAQTLALPGTVGASCPPASVWSRSDLLSLAPLIKACEEVALFQAHYGSLLLGEGQIEAAAVALEKALLLEPNLPGAQLDFAQALALVGLKGSARAILSQVLQRPDMPPELKAQLEKGKEAGNEKPPGPSSVRVSAQANAAASSWHLSALAQTAYGHETNLNSATFTDSLTLMLSNGPVTIALADSARPVAGPAVKTLLAVQAAKRVGEGPLALGELTFSGTVASKNALHSNPATAAKTDSNNTAEVGLKYSLPMIAGAASGQWQLALGGTQFWLANASAYQDSGLNLKFNWDSLGSNCKAAPSIGQTHQRFPLSESLNGNYRFARMELSCRKAQQESALVLGGGYDSALSPTRPGGNKHRQEVLLRHESTLPSSLKLWPALSTGQISAWLRYTKTADTQIYSELLGDLKTSTHKADWGLGYWVPVAKRWSAGINLEATSQKSNNTLFNLKNSSIYAGIRWGEN